MSRFVRQGDFDFLFREFKTPTPLAENAGRVGHPEFDLPPGSIYFNVFTYSATALASSAESPEMAFLCGTFLASAPLVSRSVI